MTFNPTAPGAPTIATIASSTHVTGLACPSVSQCTAIDDGTVGDYSGREMTFNPTAPGTPTQTTIDPGTYPENLACPSASQCTAVDNAGRQVTFNPTAPGDPDARR